MPTENPFPLNIADKQDSWEKLQLMANLPEGMKYDSEEFNKILQALKYLYENIGGLAANVVWGAITGDITVQSDLMAYLSLIVGSNKILDAGYRWKSDYIYEVLYVKYSKDSQVINRSINQEYPLSAADPVNDRFDILAFNFDTETVTVVEGIAAAEPALPVLGPNQAQITFIKVTANTTAPVGVSNEIVYDENDDWAANHTVTVNPDDVSNPKSGAKSIKFSPSAQSAYIELTRANSLNVAAITAIVMDVYIEASINKLCYVAAADSGTVRQSVLIVHNNFGYDKNKIGEWQTIVIPAAALQLDTIVNLEEIALYPGLNSEVFYIDNIIIQQGTEDTTPNGNFLPTGGYGGTAADIVAMVEAVSGVDLSDYLTRGGYAGTAADIKALIDNLVTNDITESADRNFVTDAQLNDVDNIPFFEDQLNALGAILNSDDPSLDILQEIVDFIKINKNSLDQIQLLLQSNDSAYDTLQEIVNALKTVVTKLATIRARPGIVATGVSGTYNIDLALSIHWKITMTGATNFTFSNFDKALGETTSIQFTGAVPSLNLTKVNVTPSSQDPDAAKRNLAVVNVIVSTSGSEIVDWQNTIMTA